MTNSTSIRALFTTMALALCLTSTNASALTNDCGLSGFSDLTGTNSRFFVFAGLASNVYGCVDGTMNAAPCLRTTHIATSPGLGGCPGGGANCIFLEFVSNAPFAGPPLECRWDCTKAPGVPCTVNVTHEDGLPVELLIFDVD